MNIKNYKPISENEIRTFLNKENKHMDIMVFQSIDSTNNYGKELAAKGLKNPTLIIAEAQSAGRGRLGRSFYSPTGSGLYMTLTFQIDFSAEKSILITTATAVAICRAIKKVTDIDTNIKWVNDIIYNNKKLCGILAEGTADNKGNLKYINLGIGLNFDFDSATLPKEISDIAISLFNGNSGNITRSELCAEIVNEIFLIFSNLDKNDFLYEYKSRSIVLNKNITYIKNNKAYDGIAVDIDDDGGLLVQKKDNSVEKLISNEITIRYK